MKNPLPACKLSIYVTISVTGLENGQYAIYNQAGQVLLAGDFDKAIDVRKLANGTYFLHLNGQVLPFIKTAQ